MTECHAQRIGSVERHRSRTCHGEHILRRVIRPRIRAITEGLTGVVVREFQAGGGKRHATDVECRTDRQIKAFQVSVGNHQSRRRTVTECRAQRVHSVKCHIRVTRHREDVLRRIVGPCV